MRLDIFDVEHGACSLLTADDNTRLMIDCGHNASTGWKAGFFLLSIGVSQLDMLAITNYDEDHVGGIGNLFDHIDVRWLWRNSSVTGQDIRKLKRDNGMGPGIKRLVDEIENTFALVSDVPQPPQPTFNGLKERKAFYNKYPIFENENNLSMAVFLDCHGVGVLYTGDLEREGLEKLLENPEFVDILSKTNVYIAPHHGRDSGCSEEVAKYLTNVFYVVISDKKYTYDTQKTIPFYEKIAKGGPFRWTERKVLTTRNDGQISFSFSATGWWPF